MRLADAPSGRLSGGSMIVAVIADDGQTASAAFIGDYSTALRHRLNTKKRFPTEAAGKKRV